MIWIELSLLELSVKIIGKVNYHNDTLQCNKIDLPARRACLSFLPCKISSSSFLFLSSSSKSLLSPNSLIRCKKSFTSSEPSAGEEFILAEGIMNDYRILQRMDLHRKEKQDIKRLASGVRWVVLFEALGAGLVHISTRVHLHL